MIMQGNPQILKSFFDEETPNADFEFYCPEKCHQTDINTPPLIKENLIKLLPNSTIQSEGIYGLHNKVLAFYKVYQHFFFFVNNKIGLCK